MRPLDELRARLAWGTGTALVFVAAAAWWVQAGMAEPRPVTFRTQTMGTWASLSLVTTDSAASAPLAYDALIQFHSLDSLLTNWNDDSEVARINRTAGQQDVYAHPEVARLLSTAVEVGEQSSGAFDITVEPLVRLWGFLGGVPRVPEPASVEAALESVGWDGFGFDEENRRVWFSRADTRIDLGAIAKGYAVDNVSAFLDAQVVSDYLVDLSGNMVARGQRSGREGWLVGVRDPRNELPDLGRVLLRDEAIATSGNYEQFVSADGRTYGHILDPRTGWPAADLASVTVVGPAAVLCDAWATALFVLGGEASRQIASERADLAVLLVEIDDQNQLIVWIEDQLRASFVPHPSLPSADALRYF